VSFCTHCNLETCEGCPIAAPGYMEEEAELGRISTLHGWPDCPFCYHRLDMRNPPMKDGQKVWGCPECGTEWDVLDLIKALNGEE
jgi:transposase-like protein